MPHSLKRSWGTNPSYAWRVIWDTRKVLFKGIRWRIRDDMIFKVWTKPWVPGFDNLADYSIVLTENMKGAKVNSLLDPCSNS